MKTNQRRRALFLAASGSVALLSPTAVWAADGNAFNVDYLVSDIPGLADFTDPNLVNPWGLTASGTSPFWVANNGTGTSTLYNGAGQPRPQTPLVVTIPTSATGTPPSAPTGTVFNGGSAFEVAPGQPARFLFATEDGTISGWNPNVNGTQAIREVDNGAVYKGLTIGNNGSGDLLYAADFGGGKVDVFNGTFSPTSLAGAFTDPNLPRGYSPFNIQNLEGKLYVTYAQKEANGDDDVPGPGNGFVSVFDLNGNLISRLVSQGQLNSPWGLVIAPEEFGPFEGDLLVGNFGDGTIHAYNPTTGEFIDTLKDANGNPIVIDGLWALLAGNGAQGGDADDLYFTAGIFGETHGLFGEIGAADVPDTGSTGWLFAVAVFGLASYRRRV